jgi:hypothetical protein
MKLITRQKLLTAWQYCDDQDKSTEFMLQYMQDVAGVDLDCVIAFLEKTTDEERIEFVQLQKQCEKRIVDEINKL